MKIQEYAKQNGVSPQAVYKRLKKKGIQVQKLVDPDTKELSQFGVEELDNLYKQTGSVIKRKPKVESLEEQKLNSQVEELRKQLEEQRAANESLSAQLVAAKELIVKAEKNAAAWQEQAQNAMQVQLMLAAKEANSGVHPLRAVSQWLSRKLDIKKEG